MQEFEPIKRFFSLLQELDRTFIKLGQNFQQEVRCRPGCVDCCHACFDISFIEAAMIHLHLKSSSNKYEQVRLSERAQVAGAEIEQKLRDVPGGMNSAQVLEELPFWRIRCPLLSDEDRCDLYEIRPITCRVYGLPTAIRGQGHVCGLSGFEKGKQYPTVKLDSVFGYLQDLSRGLATLLGDKALVLCERRFFVHEAILMDLPLPKQTDAGISTLQP